jgi:hypothetical protein
VIALSRTVIEQVYTDKERYEEVPPLEDQDMDEQCKECSSPEDQDTDEESETEKVVGKKRRKILFHADDLAPLINRRLNKARMDDEEMGISLKGQKSSERKGHKDRDEDKSPVRVPNEFSKADS